MSGVTKEMEPDEREDDRMHILKPASKQWGWGTLLQVLLAVPVSAICCGVAWWLTIIAMSGFSEYGYLAASLVGLVVFVGIMVIGIKSDGKFLRPALEVLVLVVLVAWGLTLNFMMPDSCQRPTLAVDGPTSFDSSPSPTSLGSSPSMWPPRWRTGSPESIPARCLH